MSRFDKKNMDPDSSWMETYGDMVTLLLCFFVMLASISKIDASMFEKIQSGLTKEMGKHPAERPIEAMRQDLTAVLEANKGMGEAGDVGTDDRGVVLNLDASTLFAQGSADLKQAMLPLLKDLVGTITQPRFENYHLEIQGHTDNTPIKTQQFPTNFDLAAARALAIMRALADLGIKQDRMTMSSFGQFSPRVPNTLDDGTPLPANQAMNRRVSVRIYPR